MARREYLNNQIYATNLTIMTGENERAESEEIMNLAKKHDLHLCSPMEYLFLKAPFLLISVIILCSNLKFGRMFDIFSVSFVNDYMPIIKLMFTCRKIF